MFAPQMTVDPREVEYLLNIVDREYLREPEAANHKIANQQTTLTPIYLQNYDPDCTQNNYPGSYTRGTTTSDSLPSSPETSDTSSPSKDSDISSSPASTTPTSPSSSRQSSSLSPRATQYDHQCTECGRSFSLKGELHKHWYARHEKRFICTSPGCGRAFGLKTDLKKHFLKHSRPEEKAEIACEYDGCSKTFGRKDNMLKHMKKIHGSR